MIDQQASVLAGDRSVEAAGRNGQCSAQWRKEDEPVSVLKAVMEELKEPVALDDPVVVCLVLMNVPALLGAHRGRADGVSLVLNQVNAV